MLFLATGIEREEDREYLVSFYQRYYRIMKKKAHKILNDYDLADDMVQNALLKLIPYIEKLRRMDEPALRSYIYRTVQSVISNYFRSQHKEAPFLDEQYAGPSFTDDIDNKVTVDSLLSRLTSKQRDLLIYRYFMGYRLKEIAQIMNLNPKNIKMEMKRAKEASLKALERGEKHEK